LEWEADDGELKDARGRFVIVAGGEESVIEGSREMSDYD
jgi:hypothetical protein